MIALKGSDRFFKSSIKAAMAQLAALTIAVSAMAATPATKPAIVPAPITATATAIGEKEFEEALKEYLKTPARESEAAKVARQKAIIDGLVGQVIFKGKLGREEAKNGKIEVDVVDDSPTRTIVVTKTRDTVTGGKIGKDITIGGEVVGATIAPAKIHKVSGKITALPRITITVK